MLKRLAACLLLLVAWSGLCAPAPAQQVVYARMPAHPALWTVHGPKGTAYLFGSLHVLPPEVDWRTKEIDAAMAKADVLVFEIAMDDNFRARTQAYIREHGLLPEGEHLRDMLTPAARDRYDALAARLGLAPAALDRMRPWLAMLTIEVAGMKQKNYKAETGVEFELETEAERSARPVIGLETVDQQMNLLAPSDPEAELQAFEASLKTSGAPAGDAVGPLLDAWMHGRVDRIAALTARELSAYPKAKKLLFDDRNAAWVKQIAALLEQDKTYFITVGAGHLAGPEGVPALLRKKGYRVDGP